MSKNPFGGFSRLDKLEPQRFLGPHDPPEKAVLLACILDALHTYFYFGLGDEAPDGSPRGNGTTAFNFYADFLYLFVIRASKPRTWEHARVMKDVSKDETGKRRTTYKTLSDTQLRTMCLDQQYTLLNMPWGPLEWFLQLIRERRQEVLAENEAQIQNYLRLMREHSTKYYLAGHMLPLSTGASEIDMRILLDPWSAQEVAELVDYVPRCYKAKVARERLMQTWKPEVCEAYQKETIRLAAMQGPIFEAVA